MTRFALRLLLAGLAVSGVCAVNVSDPIYNTLMVLGAFRTPQPNPIAAPDFITINDTINCEDLHHYAPGNKLFSACEDNPDVRYTWFPPLVNMYGLPNSAGSLHVIDLKTLRSTRLTFTNFDEPFVTHGIDVIADPANPSAVYIFAVNHLPNPAFFFGSGINPDNPGVPLNKAISQIELFHHVLNSTTATHVRSIKHSSITTPNDIYAVNPMSFYVTNDHLYREGEDRQYEDVVPTAKWSNTIHVELTSLSINGSADSQLTASVALTGIHNNNGMGHGSRPGEVLVTSAMSGILYRTVHDSNDPKLLKIDDYIGFNSTIDNPSYFKDPYANMSYDASGYVLGGLARAVDLGKNKEDHNAKDGVEVWYVTKSIGNSSAGGTVAGNWETRLLWEDDGTTLRTASTAVLVAIDPKTEGGKKKAWLFVTGFLSANMVALKVNL